MQQTPYHTEREHSDSSNAEGEKKRAKITEIGAPAQRTRDALMGLRWDVRRKGGTGSPLSGLHRLQARAGKRNDAVEELLAALLSMSSAEPSWVILKTAAVVAVVAQYQERH